jgi:hypothetical protein
MRPAAAAVALTSRRRASVRPASGILAQVQPELAQAMTRRPLDSPDAILTF